MKRAAQNILIFALLFLCITCGGNIGTGAGNPPSPSTKAAAALASLFSSSNSASVSAALVAQSSQGQFVQADFCNNLSDSPSDVQNSAFNDAGTYGSSERSVTLTADDFCTQPDGTVNTGSGPDGQGVFGKFEILSDVTTNCTSTEGESTSVSMLTGSSGVFRNTDATTTDAAYFPQIYGTFSVSNGESTATVDCTLFLLEDQTVAYASCSDESGEVITQDEGDECSVNAN